MLPILILLTLVSRIVIAKRPHRSVELPLKSALEADSDGSLQDLGNSILKIGLLASSK